jgi:dTDP-4-dehydrorhamnose reductase
LNDRRSIVFGAEGQLGRQIVTALKGNRWDVKPLDRDDVDIEDPDAVHSCILTTKPAVVINCAGMTNVDGCESREKDAMQINGLALAPMAAAANEIDASLVYISTDYVFDGQSNRPYSEDETVHPLNVYARSKALGENETTRAKKYLIVRTAWLFSPNSKNFVATILKKAAAGGPLNIVNDQTGSPSYAPDVAAATVELLNADACGIVHVTNTGEATWFELARKAVELAGYKVELKPIATTQYPSPATRPPYSVLNSDRLKQFIGRQLRPWHDALNEFIKQAKLNPTDSPK